jgi:hypothetical protein
VSAKPTLAARLNDVLGQLLLLPDAGAIDPTKDNISVGRGGHGTHKERGIAPSGTFAALEERPAVIQWAARFGRMLDVAERELEEARSGAVATSAKGARTGAVKDAEDRTILKDYVGMDPTTVAYIFGRTTEGIRKLRGRKGLDPATGERAQRDTLTPRVDPETSADRRLARRIDASVREAVRVAHAASESNPNPQED